ncbi:HAMP domain-containing sensor histidine kinase [Enterococcus faecium]|uniref:HAMP domain-containing sensor histidine kinase n=2 Tax=Enterococcus faecium TaxID=1352 RepID=UPI001E329103|nr:HAMP domain-containing sensor histidine kinase [Enterococcus faecium]MCM6887157.1 HAMP domain-containing histidine kinase [Enterococcus faecium]MCM6915482.1 HAMP domain-containing histidine kinase [Enterococcus faecium]MCM6929110.1 HAMP domain-containing histidine kinase [Enterococcus faecium]MDT6393110.1 HAMP domain-containing histidine kinase [Enterococcus faecium]MDT6562063.1 HAMP domain-containing histidine kinase [Enterococcus faecium]
MNLKYTSKVFFSLLFFFLLIYLVVSGFTLHAIYQRTVSQEKEVLVNQQKNLLLLLSTKTDGDETTDEMRKNGEFVAAAKIGEFEILDKKGKTVFSTKPTLFEKYDSPKELSNHIVEISDMVTVKNKKILYSTSKIPDTTYRLATYHQAKNYEEIAKDSLVYFRLILLFLLLAIIPVTYFLTSMILKPINQLISVAQHITEGKTKERAIVNTQDEIGKLGNSLNNMADKLNYDLETLRQAKENQDLFVSSFSHEIRTPLTSIIGYAQMLKWEKLDQSAEESVDYILEESNRLKHLSNDILKLIELERTNVSLEEISTSMISNDLNKFLKGMKQGFTYTIELEPANILLDINLFKLLAMNILANSLEAIAEDGKLVVKGIKKEKRYILQFSDNGRGIPAENLSKVTDEFFTGNPSRTTKHLGLGLALVKKITELHNSSFDIESTLDSGTMITIDFALGGETDEN